MQILQFSGGIDSLACLHLLKDVTGLVVLTATTDGAYPDRSDYLDKIAKAFPRRRFVEVTGNRELEKYGRPVDILPIKWTRLGSITQGTPLRYQSYMECCNRALWQPMAAAVKKLGATVVYRGQRLSDQHQAPIKDGHVEDGVTYRFPIGNWSRDQVVAYVTEHCPLLVPDYYQKEKTSRDCWDCTAYLNENMVRINELPPEWHKQVADVLNQWDKDVSSELRW